MGWPKLSTGRLRTREMDMGYPGNRNFRFCRVIRNRENSKELIQGYTVVYQVRRILALPKKVSLKPEFWAEEEFLGQVILKRLTLGKFG